MKVTQFSPILLLLILNGCGGNFIENDSDTTASSSSYDPGETEPGARIIFNDSSFTDLNDFVAAPNTSYQCLGDVLRVYYVDGDDYMGSPTALPTPSIADDLAPTNRPAFIRNVSVDMTSTYYPTTEADIVASDSCSYRAIASAPAPSSCADFDVKPTPTPAPTIAPTPTPSPSPFPTVTPSPSDDGANEYFGSGYYRVRDLWCTSQGPIVSPDPEVTKSGVGGVTIDIDREELGSNEDLLMVVTYHALNENSSASNWPATQAIDKDTGLSIAGTNSTSDDQTILKVSLIGTQLSLDNLLQVPQPRQWTYNNTNSYPIYMKDIATLEDPFGSLRTEQVYVPLSQNVLVDRIRIERVRGSFHLYQVDLYRLGNRAE